MGNVSRNLLSRIFLKNILFVGIISSILSCSLSSEDISTDPSVKLRFSADTIFFDTIFSEIPSISKRLRVYNNQSQAVSIASIQLADANTPYTITVNGIEGTTFENTKILANDSILLLLKANIETRDNDNPYVVEDLLKFTTNGNQQGIPVFSWGQDANYLKDSILVCNTTWKAGKPYVIVDNILVDSLCTLTIEPGVKVFSHIGSTIYIKGSIKSNGSADKRIVFMNDRFDGDYANYPGQWSGIIFLEGSKANEIKYTDIRNAEIGLWLGTPDKDEIADLILENSIIENMSEIGVLAFTSDLEMTNCLLDNTGKIVFAGFAGGNYTLQHNTIANYGFGFFKSQPSFVVSDQVILADKSVIQAPVNLIFKNNIVWGSSQDEITLLHDGGQDFVITMSNNLLKTSNDFFTGNNNIINKDPLFIDPGLFDYQLDSLSPAINAGTFLGISIDLLGKPRELPPDIGAYEKR
jgi:hypothetical protein